MCTHFMGMEAQHFFSHFFGGLTKETNHISISDLGECSFLRLEQRQRSQQNGQVVMVACNSFAYQSQVVNTAEVPVGNICLFHMYGPHVIFIFLLSKGDGNIVSIGEVRMVEREDFVVLNEANSPQDNWSSSLIFGVGHSQIFAAPHAEEQCSNKERCRSFLEMGGSVFLDMFE